MKKILYKYWPILVCLLATSGVVWPLVLSGYFSHHDDLQIMRIFEMRKCIIDFQIPCRWVSNMGYGNGYPLFNYYAPFPYYIGALASFLIGFIGSAKLLFAIPIFLGAVSMYFLAFELFGILPAILAAVLYTYAPYKALDLYVRGDITESFALALIPLVFYFSLKLIKMGKIKHLIALAITLSFFLTSHNIMTVLFLPIFFVVSIYWLFEQKGSNKGLLLISLIIGFGLSAYFIMPAFFEKNLVQIDNLIRLDLNFRAHFIDINQLFISRFWGYGASSAGPNDTISFQIGWPHWWIAILAVAAFIFNFLRRRKLYNILPFLVFLIFLSSVFMTHIRSSFIWERIEILKFTQFPWRFLSIAVFMVSLLGAYSLHTLKGKLQNVVFLILIILTVILNWSYFKPKEFYFDLTDEKKLSGLLWETQSKAAILDYLPKTALEPKEPAPNFPQVISGQAVVKNFINKSNRWQFVANVSKTSTIEIPVFDFPKWEVKVNNLIVSYSNNNYLGRIDINLEKGGPYFVSGNFKNTPVRSASNIISMLSLISLFAIFLKWKK